MGLLVKYAPANTMFCRSVKSLTVEVSVDSVYCDGVPTDGVVCLDGQYLEGRDTFNRMTSLFQLERLSWNPGGTGRLSGTGGNGRYLTPVGDIRIRVISSSSATERESSSTPVEND